MNKFVKEYPKPTAMPRALWAIALGVVVALIALNLLAHASRLDVENNDAAWVAPLLSGNALPLLTSSAFWTDFPGMPKDPASLVEGKSGVAALCIVALCALVFRRLTRGSWSRVGAATAVLSAAPLVAVALMPAQLLPNAPGRWLGFMVVAALYGALCCIAFALLDFARPELPARARAAARSRDVERSRPAAA